MALFQVEKPTKQDNLLSNKYLVPPFSIFNTIRSNWQKRKREWLKLGFIGTDGRDTKRYNATPTNTFSARGGEVKEPESISEFDPFLAEILIKWFSRENDSVLDPFAGGVTRGLVAYTLNRDYFGIDISPEQVSSNQDQMKKYREEVVNSEHSVNYRIGDAESILTERVMFHDARFDMLFTCPPYYNLEIYTKNSNDLSRCKTYEEFRRKFNKIINYACQCLKYNSFAVIVVSEIRNPSTGAYYGFVPDTIEAFRRAGLYYYNEIILENNIGSLPIRAPKYFNRSRKVGRQHQNVLVFWKGDPAEIEKKFGSEKIICNPVE